MNESIHLLASTNEFTLPLTHKVQIADCHDVAGQAAVEGRTETKGLPPVASRELLSLAPRCRPSTGTSFRPPLGASTPAFPRRPLVASVGRRRKFAATTQHVQEANNGMAPSVAEKTQQFRIVSRNRAVQRGGVSPPNFIRIDPATLGAMPVLECCGVADRTAVPGVKLGVNGG